MRNKFLNFLIVPFVLLSLLFGLVPPAQAMVAAAPTDITLFQINQSEIQLNGPYESSSVSFGLPATWKLTAGATLKLNMAVSFSAVSAQADAQNHITTQGGTLTVRLNSVSIGVIPLNQTGEVSQTLDIPADALVSQRADGHMELGFILNSGISCFVNQQMTVFIHTNSTLSLNHDDVAPDTGLVNFPRPLFQDSVFPETALIVIPDKPTSSELRAALTVSAGLGSLAGTTLTMDLVTLSKLTPDQQKANQIILVGKAASLPVLKDLIMPLAAGDHFALGDNAADNGVVEMINSPWNKGNVILVVAGNTDAGVVKAAQAVSTGVLRPNTAPNLAVVEQVEPDPVKVSTPVDQTLADLLVVDKKLIAAPGKAIKTLRFGNVANASYRFYMPPGQTVSPSAFFELVFGHSSLVNYGRSGIVVLINGQPVGTVRMSDETAALANNHAKFTIPASVVLPGYNRLEIRANLVPNDVCTDPTFEGLWATIWPESNLHLPLTANQVDPMSVVDLSAYPAPFVLDPTLAGTAFVLPHDDPAAWSSASRIASFLGARSKGAFFTFATYYGDELKDPDRANYNILMIGRPSQLPIITDLNPTLPAPFDPSSDVAIESNMQVKFNIPSTAPAGYVQLLTSPWNKNNLIVAALGNSPLGVSWAASSLVDAPLRTRLAGNFAVINGTQVVSTDTRLSTVAGTTDNNQINISPAAAQALDLTPPPANRPAWILPTIYTALALLGLVLILAIIGGLRRSR
ncbi:MAG TPA: cellulose biosynthesis cyclic di-GMP-binding regulatory protein BcsB [Anaerolineales bacterium]|jgi:hypothetical protein